MQTIPDHSFCIAPMMDWTDRHERYFLRLLTTRALLYTEMLTSAALVRGDASHLLKHNIEEYPLGLQLGGSDPLELAVAARLAEDRGFAEINLNIGCPSDRVQSGRFGACLMSEPQLVAECVASIHNAIRLPVTLKCRIGIDAMDSDEELARFVETVASAGCENFIIHARIAILNGLSPKENRSIPPLNYQRVFAMKKRFPELQIILNGGITNIEEGRQWLDQVDGIMVGREAYQNPFILHLVDSLFFNEPKRQQSRIDILQAYLPYVRRELEAGTPLHHMTRHVLGLFRGVRGGKYFRRHISENSHNSDASINVLLDGMKFVSQGSFV
ncbi:MAG: tRNA dihydrouridine(20/20a) synthase DusA [Gammaproteobacteria bacterium]|nr:tRNA dihydrouridine(20/20a) synthase DusA [Gammaproteobacteria bacterium]